MDVLPDEVVIHIFREILRHNPRHLFQLRTVCKRWNELIRTPFLYHGGSLFILQYRAYNYPCDVTGRKIKGFTTFPIHFTCIDPVVASGRKLFTWMRPGAVYSVSVLLWVDDGKELPALAGGNCVACWKPLARRLGNGEFCDIREEGASEQDHTVGVLQVEDNPHVTYRDVGGLLYQIATLRRWIQKPLLLPRKCANLHNKTRKGVLLIGPPGTGKTLCARALAHGAGACFVGVSGSRLARNEAEEASRIVREVFDVARTKKSCLIFVDNVDALGAAQMNGCTRVLDSSVEQSLRELISQIDCLSPQGQIKVLLSTSRPGNVDPALVCPGRIDCRLEFGLPSCAERLQIFKIHTEGLRMDMNIRLRKIAILCEGRSGAEIRSICAEATRAADRDGRAVATEMDFLEAVISVV